jgi:hypothetical protein
MGHALAQVVLQRTSGLPEDVIVNTFHFETPTAGVVPSDVSVIAADLEEFYDVAPAGGGLVALRTLMNQSIAATGHRLKVYDMSDPQPRSPVGDVSLPVGPFSGAGLPAEVAMVLSLRGALISGVNPGRTRGRIYFGPLATTVLTATAGVDVRPAQFAIDSLVGAGLRLANYAATHVAKWRVYSGTDDVLRPITSVVVDNAFDTQRRRGADPNARTTGVVT